MDGTVKAEQKLNFPAEYRRAGNINNKGFQQTMWQYLIYFLIGGTLVAAVAYIGTHSNGILAALVSSLPALFILNVVSIYRNAGVVTSVEYVNGVLLFVPSFVCYAALTAWLLPHLKMPLVLLPGIPIYLLPVLIRRTISSRPYKTENLLTQPPQLLSISGEEQIENANSGSR